jgi:hypothetical protein
VKYNIARKCHRRFKRKFSMVWVPNRNTVHNLVSKVRTIGILIDMEPKHQHWILTEEKLDEFGAQLEHLPCKSLKTPCTRNESIKRDIKNHYKITETTAYKITIVQSLQQCDSVARCSIFSHWWYLKTIVYWTIPHTQVVFIHLDVSCIPRGQLQCEPESVQKV